MTEPDTSILIKRLQMDLSALNASRKMRGVEKALEPSNIDALVTDKNTFAQEITDDLEKLNFCKCVIDLQRLAKASYINNEFKEKHLTAIENAKTYKAEAIQELFPPKFHDILVKYAEASFAGAPSVHQHDEPQPKLKH